MTEADGKNIMLIYLLLDNNHLNKNIDFNGEYKGNFSYEVPISDKEEKHQSFSTT